MATTIVAQRRIAAPADAVVDFLSDLENHVRLAPGALEVLQLERPPGVVARAIVRLKGPLAIRRTAVTELLRTAAPDLVAGRARIGDRTRASVVWRIEAYGAGSSVSLCATVDAAAPFDALLLRLGGRRWVARRFAAALDNLAEELTVQSEWDGRVLSLPQPA
jgi:carbon monoxide dehydrogenase subunit G